jgi:hypothetical protein
MAALKHKSHHKKHASHHKKHVPKHLKHVSPSLKSAAMSVSRYRKHKRVSRLDVCLARAALHGKAQGCRTGRKRHVGRPKKY